MATLAALEQLQGLAHGPIEVAPVVLDGAAGSVLALSVSDGVDHDAVIGLAVENGGRLVADVPDEWTHARQYTPSGA